jgi:ribosomal protein S18 acetylase RimI-like enzyme
MDHEIRYKTDLDGVDWHRLRATLMADSFDNGRTPEQLQESFRNSYATVLACRGDEVIGTARVLSDGVCNAYVVDVWTLSEYRRQGIGRAMVEVLLNRLEGQHVYLFTDDAIEFYRALGFEERGTGMGRVVGDWLKCSP